MNHFEICEEFALWGVLWLLGNPVLLPSGGFLTGLVPKTM